MLFYNTKSINNMETIDTKSQKHKNKKTDYEFDGQDIVKIDQKTWLPDFSSVFNLAVIVVLWILLLIWFIYIAKVFLTVFLIIYILTFLYQKFMK